MNVPVLETARLRLRGHVAADLDACAAMWADPVVTRYIGGKPSSRPQTWTRLTAYVGHWSLMTYGYWVVEDRARGSYVGEIGFADFRRGLGPEYDGTPELGWALAAEAHGKGFATEAARAALAWGDERLAATRTFCLIGDGNVASIRVATKIGYVAVDRATVAETTLGVFVRDRPPLAPAR